jgi:glycosyltransferase involved in cell wall biosynthesis
MRSLSIVMPALNEAENIARVMSTIPFSTLNIAGWNVEVIVVDNGSSDGTGEVAAAHGARVIVEPARGYGNAYKAGFDAALGEVIATGDADGSYPFDVVPELLRRRDAEGLDFLSTNRLCRENRRAMKSSHRVANLILTGFCQTVFRSPFRDSQSGMWIFRRAIWQHLDVRAKGMAFSQEIKHEAYLKGFRCAEAPIEYRVRGGEVKLHAVRDAIGNTSELLAHGIRAHRLPARAIAADA